MSVVNIHQAKTQFSKLVDAAVHGKDVTIAKAGKPTVKLVAIKAAKPPVFGVLKGKIRIPKDFDAPLPPNILKSFEE